MSVAELDVIVDPLDGVFDPFEEGTGYLRIYRNTLEDDIRDVEDRIGELKGYLAEAWDRIRQIDDVLTSRAEAGEYDEREGEEAAI
jgi:hypothetical protein